MSVPLQRDLNKMKEVLSRWLKTKIKGASAVVIDDIGKVPGAGFVNETLLVKASWTLAHRAEMKCFVIRIQPSAFAVIYKVAEFFEDQCRVIKILKEQSSIPVPTVRWFEKDSNWLGAPFFVYELIPGLTQPDIPPYFLSGWLHDATPAQQEQIWWSAVETVAKINAFDWRKAGLGFLSYGVKPDFDARFHYYLDAFEWARGESENPIVEAARDWLIVHKPDEEEPETLSWGDARLGNLIFRDFKVVGVIDWEMVSLGPPLQDLGWWFWVERALFGDLHTGNPSDPKSLPGFPSREATLERWSELTGYSTKHIDFYEVLSGFRLACHLQKMGNLFIELGVAGPESKWASNNLATQALAAMIGVDHPPPEPLPSLPLPGPG